jgi:hypothetical protein
VPATLRKLVTGGQTGVDRGALDAALAIGFPCGGWCPTGRRAEDGPLPRRYPLRELPDGTYADRTEQNVRDSDATLILAPARLTGGTRLTLDCCKRHARPHLVAQLPPVFDPGDSAFRDALAAGISFLHAVRCRTLNVAGPRASEWPDAYDSARGYLMGLLK